VSFTRVRYETRVHASNRHAGLGTPVTVYANTRREAVDRAIEVGWAGAVRDARVTVLSITEEPIPPPPAASPVTAEANNAEETK
jgi:hypothetical protein